MKTAYNHSLLVILLAALTSVTPLAVDTYLPAMPEIATFLGVGIERIEVTISIFLLFFALGQLVGGTLSDRVGRKKTALFGLLLFSLASFSLFIANTVTELYTYRAIQAFAGGVAIVNAPATVRDLFSGKEAAKVFSTIASITMIAPMVAPGIGAIILSFFPWNYIFLFLGVYSLLVALFILLKLPKTGSKTQTKILESFKRVLTHKVAVSFILAQAFSFSGMFVFIGKSSFIYLEFFQVSTNLFPILFGANVFVMIVLTRLNIKLVQTITPEKILQFGVYTQFLAGVLLLVTSFTPNLWLTFTVMTIYVGILGLIFGNGMALALEHFKHDSGVANSVIGVTQFTIAGVIGFLGSLIHSGELTPVFILMSTTPLLAILALQIRKIR